MIVYCATTNPGKLKEFRLAAERLAPGQFSVEGLPGLRELAPCDETGVTFEENAIQKALYYGAHTPGYLFVDDSGLVVDALGGAPGVYSARYAGEGAGDAANNSLVLANMAGVQDRSARFVCVVALAHGGSLVKTFRGVVEGVLLEEERGSGGFGYDPMFYYPPYGCTLAEVEGDRKLAVSHRGQALRQMFTLLAAVAKPPPVE